MNRKTENLESDLPPVRSNDTSACQQDGDTRELKITMQPELNALVNRIMDGDTEPWIQVFKAFMDIASKYSRRLPPRVREDFLSDMGQRLLTCITEKKWQDTGTPFEAWIHTTAYYAVGEWWRKLEKLSPEVQDPEFPFEDVEDPSASILNKIIRQEEKDTLWDLVMKLPDTYAKVIYWRYALKISFSEIGEKLGKTEVNSRKIHQRALEYLRQIAHESGYDPENE